MSKQAVLLLAHGTPETAGQIPEYLRNVVSGRPMPQHVVEEIQHRYSLIGKSPLTEITLEQARLVEAELAKQGHAVRVYVGMRNWRPYIPDVVKEMVADGVEEAAVICLAPQNSRTSVGLYHRAVLAEAGKLRFDFTDSWADSPLLAEAFAERLSAAQARMKAETGSYAPVLFTAHSVPTRTIQPPAPDEKHPRHWPGEGVDPYVEDARKTAELVAARVPEIPAWYFAFQSQGASGGPWIGPTVEETIDKLANQSCKQIILQPIGFLCDHIEILYDVDIAFKQYAAGKGILLARPESLNTSERLARAVANLGLQALTRLRS